MGGVLRTESGEWQTRRRHAIVFWLAAFATTLILFLQGWTGDIRLPQPHKVDFDSGLTRARFEVLESYEQNAVDLEAFEKAAAVGQRNGIALHGRHGRVWLVSHVWADHEGAALLRPWLQYYISQGVQPGHMALLIFHDQLRFEARGVAEVLRVINGTGILPEIVLGTKTPPQILFEKLKLLDSLEAGPDDWFILADPDEFQRYGGHRMLDFLAAADVLGISHVSALVQHRLSENGGMPVLRDGIPLEEQFPWECVLPVKRPSVPLTERRKIAAVKAFLRTNQEDREIVTALSAERVFGAKPKDVQAKEGKKGAMFSLTPFARFPQRYQRGKDGSPPEWEVRAAPVEIDSVMYAWSALGLDRLRVARLMGRDWGLPGRLTGSMAQQMLVDVGGSRKDRVRVSRLECSWASSTLPRNSRRVGADPDRPAGGVAKR